MINSNAIILFYFWSRFRFTFYNIRFSSHLYWMKFSLYSLQCVSVSRINERVRVRFHSCFTFTTTTTTTNVRETWRIRSRQRTVWYCVCVSVVCSGVDIPLRRRTTSRFVRFHDFVFVLRLHRSKQKLKKEEREIIYRQRVSRVSQHRAGQLKKFLANVNNVNAFFASSKTSFTSQKSFSGV